MKLLLPLLHVCLSAAQLHLPRINTGALGHPQANLQHGKLGDLSKVAAAVKEVASQSNVHKAAEALQKTGKLEARGVFNGVVANNNISEVLRGADKGKIEDIMKSAAGTLRKGVDAMDGADEKDVEAALHKVTKSDRTSSIFNMTGGQLMEAVESAVPKATKALQEAFSGEGEDGTHSDADVEAPVRRVIERVKEEVQSGSPVSMLGGVLVVGTCAVCAFINLRTSASARSPDMNYGIQLPSSNEEPFFRSF